MKSKFSRVRDFKQSGTTKLLSALTLKHSGIKRGICFLDFSCFQTVQYNTFSKLVNKWKFIYSENVTRIYRHHPLTYLVIFLASLENYSPKSGEVLTSTQALKTIIIWKLYRNSEIIQNKFSDFTYSNFTSSLQIQTHNTTVYIQYCLQSVWSTIVCLLNRHEYMGPNISLWYISEESWMKL